jgi:hypothetical protein
VTAWFISAAALAAVILSLITAVLGLMNQRKIKDAATTAEGTAGKIEKISIDVNGRLSLLFERQAQLLGALHDAGVPVPALPAPRLLVSEPEKPAPPDTGATVTKKADNGAADFTDEITVLTRFFEHTLPPAVETIQALQRQGIKNLRPFEDLLSEIPAAAAAMSTIAPTSPTSPTSTSATLPGEQTLPEG